MRTISCKSLKRYHLRKILFVIAKVDFWGMPVGLNIGIFILNNNQNKGFSFSYLATQGINFYFDSK